MSYIAAASHFPLTIFLFLFGYGVIRTQMLRRMMKRQLMLRQMSMLGFGCIRRLFKLNREKGNFTLHLVCSASVLIENITGFTFPMLYTNIFANPCTMCFNKKKNKVCDDTYTSLCKEDDHDETLTAPMPPIETLKIGEEYNRELFQECISDAMTNSILRSAVITPPETGEPPDFYADDTQTVITSSTPSTTTYNPFNHIPPCPTDPPEGVRSAEEEELYLSLMAKAEEIFDIIKEVFGIIDDESMSLSNNYSKMFDTRYENISIQDEVSGVSGVGLFWVAVAFAICVVFVLGFET